MAQALDLKKLAEALKAAGATWEMDETTSMAESTEDIRRRMLGFTPPPDEMSLEDAAEAALKAEDVGPEAIASDQGFGIPSKFDHRNINGKDFTPTIKNQGGCGSCVAFGTAVVLETTYRRQINDHDYDIDLSEAHLFYCHGGEEGRTCQNGWWPENALNKVKQKRLAFEKHYPYTAQQQACAVGNGWQSDSATLSGKNKLGSRAAIKNWIATRGPVTGCFTVFQDFFSYRSGVYRHVSGASAGGHCVAIIGYDDSQGCWICQNSWGTNWGEGGFFRIAYGQCNIEKWAGPWGANGVSVRRWTGNTRCTGFWSNDAERNAWAHLQGVGWRKLADTDDATQHAMLIALLNGKAANRTVRAQEDDGKLVQAYIL